MRKFITYLSTDRFSHVDYVLGSMTFFYIGSGEYWTAGFVFVVSILLSAILKVATGQSTLNAGKADV